MRLIEGFTRSSLIPIPFKPGKSWDGLCDKLLTYDAKNYFETLLPTLTNLRKALDNYG